MDCNKDEAVRAKAIAEKKMETNDFEGARKIAKKAQSIYPELENISQLLTICDVHCSSLKKVLGSEKDWYEILQVKNLADELTVKKQYRRLALFLHPDKNRFPGAEAAFKLICEANAVLSDPAKKSLYDSKIRASTRSAPVYKPIHNINKNPLYSNLQRAQSSVSNGSSSLNLQQAAGSNFSMQEVFWTCCPFCSTKYQYKRQFVNISVRCQKCFKMFMACEISAQSTSIGSKWGQHGFQQMPSKPSFNQSATFQERVSSQGNLKKGVGNSTEVSESHTEVQANASRNTVQQDQGIQKGGSRYSRASATFNVESVTRVERKLKNKGRRGRKQVVESSESFDASTESDMEDVSMGANGNEMDSGTNSVHPRRSTRKRQQVIYNESDEDFVPAPMDSQSRNPEGSKKERKVDLGVEDSVHGNQNSFFTDVDLSMSKGERMGTLHPEGSFQDNGADPDKEVKVRTETGGTQRYDADTIEIIGDSNDNSDPETYDYPEPEFNDFSKDRDESCFNVNQIWACYDSIDGMPRFYARVKNVCRSLFELEFAWLEADPKDAAYKNCAGRKLSFGCGSFKLGRTEKTDSNLTFSHKMDIEKGQKRGYLTIYPREGETWAIFKDMNLSSDPKNKRLKYEIVEVLSDFVAGVGIRVSYLDKITGFVSLFQRTSHNKTDLFLIGPNELYKFSHRVPCFKMTGSEREGVPRDSFELDPAALPSNPEYLFFPSKAKMKHGNLDL